MIPQERTMSPSDQAGIIPVGKSTARRGSSPLRHRPLGRASIFADLSHPLKPRRSSNLSDSLDSTRQSLKSSTDDLLLPKAKSLDVLTDHEPSHWHSAPLALALLPAIGGLFFHNGSVIVTDLTLLILAAVFLNWAVRLPWDWYHSAQAILSDESLPISDDYASDTIIEEDSEEGGEETQPKPANADITETAKEQPPSGAHSSATSELRTYELLALFTCFLAPAIGAWLLHHIRSQLSRPSEGLVSNYNLTIFLLASEIRPMAHLIKLVQARTLHLQRIVTANTQDSNSIHFSSATKQDLSSRLDDLETHIADTTANGVSSKVPTAEQISHFRKSVEPDFNALNRAVRRYEKRTTLLSMQTESRLQELEKRLSDAITLAAAAERSSQVNRQRRGLGVTAIVDWVAMMAVLPMQIGWSIITLPGSIVGGLVRHVEGNIGQKIRRELRTAGKGDALAGSGSEKRKAPRGQKKLS